MVEAEVAGTAEQVWEAVATGAGIEAWFVQAEVVPRVGGRIVTYHGMFGESEGVVTAWEPPVRFAYDEPDWSGPDTPVPVWRTEVTVEEGPGGGRVVRLASGFLEGGDAWREDIEGTFDGWEGALRNLRLYLEHFAGLPTTTLLVQRESPEGAAVPDAVAEAGLRDVQVGAEAATVPPAPHARGIVEHVGEDSVVLRIAEPSPGLLEVATFRYGGSAGIAVSAHLYGAGSREIRDRAQQAWQAWANSLAGS
ncbi:SRPBCC family protein [Actinocorallia aurea]